MPGSYREWFLIEITFPRIKAFDRDKNVFFFSETDDTMNPLADTI